jgi:hypothetical protein
MLIIGSWCLSELNMPIRVNQDIDLNMTYSEAVDLINRLRANYPKLTIQRRSSQIIAIDATDIPITLKDMDGNVLLKYSGHNDRFIIEIKQYNPLQPCSEISISNCPDVKPCTLIIGGEKFTSSMLSVKMCLALKSTHRYLKNSRFFKKTQEDIKSLCNHLGIEHTSEVIDNLYDWQHLRRQETYAYNHPKLNVTKSDLFIPDSGVPYIFDHDSIHEYVKFGEVPAYTLYLKDGAEVECDIDKWNNSSDAVKINGVMEEMLVLALERCLIPNKFDLTTDIDALVDTAIMKVCTSITSGWFRDYAWWSVMEDYDGVCLILHNRIRRYINCPSAIIQNLKLLPNQHYTI